MVMRRASWHRPISCRVHALANRRGDACFIRSQQSGVAAAAPANATIVGFCGGTYSGGQFCSRQATFSLNSISASTNGVDAVCVYRATANYDGAPSASGVEYCIQSGNSDVAQPFYGYSGNPTVHNRHSYNVAVGAAYDRN